MREIAHLNIWDPRHARPPLCAFGQAGRTASPAQHIQRACCLLYYFNCRQVQAGDRKVTAHRTRQHPRVPDPRSPGTRRIRKVLPGQTCSLATSLRCQVCEKIHAQGKTGTFRQSKTLFSFILFLLCVHWIRI